MADQNTAVSETKASKNNQPVDKKSGTSFFWYVGVLISGCAMLVLIFSLGLGYYELLTVNRTVASSLIEMKQSVEQSHDDALAAQKTVADMQQTTQQLTDKLTTQAQALADLRKLQNTGKDDFTVAEANYLLQMANENLLFDYNVPLALKLLNMADQSIASVSDPKLYAVREAISADIAALQSAPQIDQTSIYLKLSTLGDEVDKLTIANKFFAPAAPEASQAILNLPWWKRGLDSAWQALQHIVVVRHVQSDSLPFVTPEQQVFLIQNLQAEVNQAKWAILHRNSAVYQHSLQQVTNWIQLYAVQNAQNTQQMIALIHDLLAINVQPAAVNVDNSLQALQSYVKDK